jgi:pseudaminic acid biosynthesis-associated methylase
LKMDQSDEPPTAAPLSEDLWSGSFGDAYVERNAQLDDRRRGFWASILDEFGPASVLEVGCGQGGNLLPLSQILAARVVWGIDINEAALLRARANAPGVNVVYGSARVLPFRDATFDLVFTTGVLIHQPDDQLPLVMDEMVRCSARYVLSGEYHAEDPTELRYRGLTGALFKRNYRRLFVDRFPSLVIRRQGFLDVEDGFDRVTFQLFEKG